MKTELLEAKNFIQKVGPFEASIGIILGSGLGEVLSTCRILKSYDYHEIPHYPISTVEGHRGRILLLETPITKNRLIALQGRSHYYEHADIFKTVFPIRLIHLLGIKTLIVTNAAGGINTRFKPGDLMVIMDHMNLMGTNPLLGPNDDSFGPRFVDMHQAYSLQLIELLKEAANTAGVHLEFGVYAGLSGPTYETPAEIRMLRTLGADAAGMSTIPEVIVANHMGMEVLGISCISNMASDTHLKPIGHEEVIQVTQKIKAKLETLLITYLENYLSRTSG